MRVGKNMSECCLSSDRQRWVRRARGRTGLGFRQQSESLQQANNDMQMATHARPNQNTEGKRRKIKIENR